VNGHAHKRKSKRGTRWQAILHVDAAHGGPRREVGAADSESTANAPA